MRNAESATGPVMDLCDTLTGVQRLLACARRLTRPSVASSASNQPAIHAALENVAISRVKAPLIVLIIIGVRRWPQAKGRPEVELQNKGVQRRSRVNRQQALAIECLQALVDPRPIHILAGDSVALDVEFPIGMLHPEVPITLDEDPRLARRFLVRGGLFGEAVIGSRTIRNGEPNSIVRNDPYPRLTNHTSWPMMGRNTSSAFCGVVAIGGEVIFQTYPWLHSGFQESPYSPRKSGDATADSDPSSAAIF
jgi:hypothetical protein